MTSSRTAKTILNRTLSRCRHPLLLIDSERRIVYANPAAEKLLGYSIDQLSSRVCQFHDSDEGDPLSAITAKICPPPPVFSTLKEFRARFHLNPDGESDDWTIKYRPLPLDDDQVVVLAILQPGNEPGFESGNDATEISEQMRRVMHAAKEFWIGECRLEQFAGLSDASSQILVKANAAVASGANLVVFGPPGSGRQHLARAIDQATGGLTNSTRQATGQESLPMIPIDGAIADPEQVQSTFKELFGYHRDHQLPQSRLLLLNADQLSPAAQNELQGLLKISDFDIRVSSTSTISLATSHLPVPFDSALASILSTVEIEVPPLAERMEDIPILAQMFLERGNAQSNQQLSAFTDEAMDCLVQYSWPGNADEMQIVIAECRERTTGAVVGLDDLPKRIKLAVSAEQYPAVKQESVDLDRILGEMEVEIIQRALNRTKGNKTKAAELLGINRARLLRRLENATQDADPESETNPNP